MSTQNDIPRADERAIAVRLRDDAQCAICKRSQTEASLEVHEIVPNDKEAAKTISNYVLLCQEHHRKAHQTEQQEVEHV
jgi:5-methylcytosine-specific restriction endonuclease McrA